MIFTDSYYRIKPFLPRSLRLSFRRLWAASVRSRHEDTWPIDEAAGAVPPGWPGWPDGKKFALALTHDVEGAKGFGRVERLMNLESERGFRSSFNFVPEGEYRVSAALRDKMEGAGFEVGVHGLRHEWNLYSSKREFASRAKRIRQYLKEWNAVGFRSPFMQHKLAWIHQLGVEYDASTFDTDPFEPEPDGAGTVFPFWVPGPHGSGYVELPYSLAQDFTLFVVLRERNIDIWKRKLDWVAERGGMTLLNTHPDYMCFDDGRPARDEYPVRYYEEFLGYAREKYAGAFWSATPRDVARYYCSRLPVSERNTRRKICMVAYTSYESDNRVRRYAETLASRGDQVDVVALRHGNGPLKEERIRGVASFQVQKREHNERRQWTYAWRLFRFLVKSSVFLAGRHHRIRYDVIHVHNMPDFLVFAAWYPKWTGAKLILDVHDLVPELFASKFGAKESALSAALLKQVERASARFADHVIVSNDLWHKTLISRSVPKEKCSVFLNHADPALFYPHPRTRVDGKLVIIFPGSFQWHQGLDIAIQALALLRDKTPNAELHLYGGGSGRGGEAELRRLADRLGLNGSVKFCGGVPLEQMAAVLANADIGVVPKRADSFGNEAYSTKIMEFMSQGVPVVVSRTKIDTFYFDDTVVRFFESGDVQAMAGAMLDVIESPATREALVAAGYEYMNRHSWETKKADYLELVDSLSTESFAGCSR